MSPLPDHISEAELLAVIEGDEGSLSPERRQVVRAAVAGDPFLSRMVQESRTDSSALVSMSRVTAPPSVRQRVIEELRRPVQRVEGVLEPEGGAIPISSVIVDRPSAFQQFLERFPVRRLAAAAALLLAAGGGILVLSQAAKQNPVKRNDGLIAHNDGNSNELVPDPSDAIDIAALDLGLAPNVALDLPEPGELVAGPILTDDYGFAALLSQPPAPFVDMPTIAATAPKLLPDDMVALARSGRLMIRVRALDVVAAETDINDLALASSQQMRWRPLQATEFSSIASALRPRDTRTPMAAANPPRGPVSTLPSSVPERPPTVIKPHGTSADIASALKDLTTSRPLFAIEMVESEQDLLAILERLTDAGRLAEFIALEESLPTLAPSTDPAAVLWWTKDPSGWTRRVSIPVVLEPAPESK